MRIDYLGHAAFLVTTAAGQRLLFDPYESGGYDGRVAYVPIETPCDAVIITHDHKDHCYTAGLPQPFTIIRDAGVLPGVRVFSVSAFHDSEGGTRFGGSVDMKVVEADGLRLCHAGDLGEQLSVGQKNALGPLDILIIPVGGYYTLDAAGALAVVAELAPTVVIPCHFKTARCGFDIAPVTPFLAQCSEILRPGGSAWEVTPTSLPKATTCVYLEPRL